MNRHKGASESLTSRDDVITAVPCLLSKPIPMPPGPALCRVLRPHTQQAPPDRWGTQIIIQCDQGCSQVWVRGGRDSATASLGWLPA